ncbi:putative reverse transcriptase domain-containing protein [Tanacetum coccineum]
MKGVGKEMSKYLSDFQFRVGVSGDAEAILHSVNRVLSEYQNDGSLTMLTVDFSNAFNLVDRSALLHEQGDPLGPLLFALILHPLLHKIKDTCKLLLHAWYLDDGTVIGDSEEVAKVLDIIKVSGPGLGLELDIKKTKIFWPSCNGMKLCEGLFPVDIQRPSLGVKLLGGAISRDTNFISGLAMRRATNAIDLMSLLPQLHDPQTSRAQSWVLQDHILRNSDICGMDDDYVSALACLRDTIPSFDFSGFTNKDTTESSFLVSERTTCSGFLLVVPIDGLGQHMSPMEYNTILKYRLMIPLFPVDAICPICRKACLDSFGEHAVHCKELV